MEITALRNHPKADDLAPEQLAGNKLLSEQEKIHEASRQFEAILLRQILETTQKPVIKSKFSDNSTAGSVYRDMVTSQLADSISKSGAFGLAKTFEQQLQFAKGHGAANGVGGVTSAVKDQPEKEGLSPKGSEITRS
jgi:flagellar protein FlgJ